MRRTGYVYDERYLMHDPGSWHPERPDRLKAIHRTSRNQPCLELMVPIPPYCGPPGMGGAPARPRLHPAVSRGLRPGQEDL